jgi:uncharacterized membrane protein
VIPLPRVCLAAVLLAALAAPLSVAAQTPHATSSAPIQQQASASLGHAAAKGVSLKIINGVVGMAVFTTGTGSLAAGSVLAASVAATSFSVFVINDYIWDHYFPNTNIAANNESFNAAWSIGRNTAKFLTFKPAVMVADWSAIYLYTGSMASTLTMGPAYSLLSPVTFYANNVAWDWYDWWSTPAPAKHTP